MKRATLLAAVLGLGLIVVPASVAAPGPASVAISNFAFVPSPISVPVGTMITWTNHDSAMHTVSSDSGAFDSVTAIATGGTFSHAFTTPGTYQYHCNIHSFMHGTVVVNAAAPAPTPAPPHPTTIPSPPPRPPATKPPSTPSSVLQRSTTAPGGATSTSTTAPEGTEATTSSTPSGGASPPGPGSSPTTSGVRPATQAATATHHSSGTGVAAGIGAVLLLAVIAGGGLVVARARAQS